MNSVHVLVDDHLLLQILLGAEPSGLGPAGGRVHTTGLWYHRLGRALADPRITGSMSRALGEAEPTVAAAAVAAVVSLPEEIGVLSLRELAGPMAELVSAGLRLNLMSLEAIAAARRLEATICLAPADDNPPLLEAASRLDIPVRVVT